MRDARTQSSAKQKPNVSPPEKINEMKQRSVANSRKRVKTTNMISVLSHLESALKIHHDKHNLCKELDEKNVKLELAFLK